MEGRLELILTDLRLPTVKRLAVELCAQSDREGWPANRLLEALFEQGGQKILMKKPVPFKADIEAGVLMDKIVEAYGGADAINSIKTLRYSYTADMENL